MEITCLEIIQKALIGKTVTLTHIGPYNAMAALEIENVTFESESHELGPSTPENDWWPPTETIEYLLLHFKGKTTYRFRLTDKLIIN